MKLRLVVATSLLVGLGAELLLISMPVAAKEVSASTLRVSPLRSDVEVNPGESRKVKVTVTNPTDQPIDVLPVVNDFVAQDEDGTPALLLNDDSHANHHSFKRLTKAIDSVTIPAKESHSIEVEISTPPSLEPGGYFGVVRLTPADTSGGQVNMSASVASLILMRVKGDAPERLNLTNFDVQQQGNSKRMLFDSDNLSILVRFENTGGVQLSPTGKISVMKSGDVVFETDFNDKIQHDLVLPNSARRWNIPIEGLGGMGLYTATATFTYGSNNRTVEVTKSFWVIPRSLIAVAAGSLVVLVAAVVGVVLRRRAAARRRPRFGRY